MLPIFDFEDLKCDDLPVVPIPHIDLTVKKYKNMLSKKRGTRLKGADKYFSRAVRLLGLKRMINKGVGPFYVEGIPVVLCATCDRMRPIKHYIPANMIQCGHYMTRGKMPTRFDFKNCNPQCYICNERNKGEQALHGSFIDKVYGKDSATTLIDRSKMVMKFSNWHLLTIEEWCKGLVKELEEEIGWGFDSQMV